MVGFLIIELSPNGQERMREGGRAGKNAVDTTTPHWSTEGRGHVHMTSTEGEDYDCPKADYVNDDLRGRDNVTLTREEGGPNMQKCFPSSFMHRPGGR